MQKNIQQRKNKDPVWRRNRRLVSAWRLRFSEAITAQKEHLADEAYCSLYPLSEDTVNQENAAPSRPTTEYRGATVLSTIVAAAIIASGMVIALVVYRIHQRDYLAAQADSSARTFIRSSPVVEQQLGRVQTVKQISEEHLSGKAPGWYLDYRVTGRRGKGMVEMRMNPSQYDYWNFPLAELDEGRRKPIDLR
jgi:hypothetical protein